MRQNYLWELPARSRSESLTEHSVLGHCPHQPPQAEVRVLSSGTQGQWDTQTPLLQAASLLPLLITSVHTASKLLLTLLHKTCLCQHPSSLLFPPLCSLLSPSSPSLAHCHISPFSHACTSSLSCIPCLGCGHIHLGLASCIVHHAAHSKGKGLQRCSSQTHKAGRWLCNSLPSLIVSVRWVSLLSPPCPVLQ